MRTTAAMEHAQRKRFDENANTDADDEDDGDDSR